MIDYELIFSLVLSAAIIFVLGWCISWYSDKIQELKNLRHMYDSLQRQMYKKQDKKDGW